MLGGNTAGVPGGKKAFQTFMAEPNYHAEV
jgi:hypothetical protein